MSRTGHRRVARDPRNVRVYVTLPNPAIECFTFLAARRGLTLSGWVLEACNQQAAHEGGDPLVGAP